jgi:pimeloyl-ACP methyl ester carboxylesterase
MNRRFFLPMIALACACAASPKPRTSPAPVTAAVRAADGVKIAFDARGEGEPSIVFIHGWCCDRTFWLGQLDAFAADHRVVAIDLVGHGTSGVYRDRWTVDGLAGDVQMLVEGLDLKRVVLVGHSMGGPVALLAAARMPGRVVAVVGIDTLQDVEREIPKEMADQIMHSFEEDFAGTMKGFMPSMFPPDADPKVVAWVIEKATATNQTAALGLFRDFLTLDVKHALESAHVPVRCINSVPRPPMGIPTATDRNRKHGDFDAVEMKGVGHYPMLERPAEFNARLRETIATLPRS